MTDRRELIEAARRHLEENDGEFVYWGETLKMPAKPEKKSDLQKAVIPAQAGIHVESGPRPTIRRGDDTLPSVPSAAGSKTERLRVLRDETIGDCHRCPLGDTRIKLAFGVGNPEAEVVFIGEGPGYQEDRQGEPFVGPAGQLLDKILAAIQLDRTTVYIANVVKCHPMKDPSQPDKRGNDRAPSSDEMASCLPFLREQIKIIRPRFIVALGAVSTRALLGDSRGITALRGKWFDFAVDDTLSVPLMPTYHPAALLRDPELKKDVWEDMKLLRGRLASSSR